MIKPVSVMNSVVKTPAVRNFATATMLTLVVLGVGACAGGSNKTTEQTQTEIVSAEGAEALKAVTISNQPLYSKEPNKKLVEKICDWAVNFHDAKVLFWDRDTARVIAKQMANINELHDAYGTFAGAVEMQRTYNLAMLEKHVGGCIYDNSVPQKMKERGFSLSECNDIPECRKYSNVQDALVNGYYTSGGAYYKVLRNAEGDIFSSNKNSAQEISALLDSHVEKFDYWSKSEKKDYKKAVEEFRSKQADKYSPQGYSDYIAFQVFTMDRIVYTREFKKVGLHREKGFDKAFAEFAKATAPTP